jgi:transcriptional regulator with XRE-family HTH domain
MILPAQSRAARALLNWSQPELAQASGVSVSTIRDFETGKRSPIGSNLAALNRALERAGIEFLPAGARLPSLIVNVDPPESIDCLPDSEERRAFELETHEIAVERAMGEVKPRSFDGVAVQKKSYIPVILDERVKRPWTPPLPSKNKPDEGGG